MYTPYAGDMKINPNILFHDYASGPMTYYHRAQLSTDYSYKEYPKANNLGVYGVKHMRADCVATNNANK
jgi:hypothetical protein